MEFIKFEINYIFILRAGIAQFEKSKNIVRKLFNPEAAENEMKHINEHLDKVKNKLKNKKHNKVQRDLEKQVEVVDNTIGEKKKKKKRKFKRKYLQPQPKKNRRRRRNFEATLDAAISAGWNRVIKNISGDPVTETEEILFAKGQKFCPVELDPPIVRMQRELDRFFRILRIKWVFDDKRDKRTELEKVFYEKSSWEPPKACKEIENMISKLQDKFDKWTPPRFIKDNLSKGERNLLTYLKNKEDLIYKWEDKGPSFTKMTRDQYIHSGEKELQNPKFYNPVQNDPSKGIKQKSDILVQNMHAKGEISESAGFELVHLGFLS